MNKLFNNLSNSDDMDELEAFASVFDDLELYELPEHEENFLMSQDE